MGLELLIFLTAIASADADYKTACTNKAKGDKCEYQSDQGTCCDMVKNQAGNMEKFCRACSKPGAMTTSECSLHSREGYLACFSKKEDAAVFQVCIGQNKGSDCMYETAASKRGGKSTPAYNTTGHCIAHYDHQQTMCLVAVGGAGDGACNGKGVGTPCEHKDSTNAICSHHSRRGTWMCLAPKEEKMVFIVCQGKDTGASCSFNHAGGHGMDKGLIQGACYPHDGHGGMMCMDPAHAPTSTTTAASSLDSSSGADHSSQRSPFAYAVIVIASFACTN